METEENSKQSEENLVKNIAFNLGITQGELGKMIGVSRTTINNWNNNNVPIPKWGENFMYVLLELKELRDLKRSLKTVLQSEEKILSSL